VGLTSTRTVVVHVRLKGWTVLHFSFGGRNLRILYTTSPRPGWLACNICRSAPRPVAFAHTVRTVQYVLSCTGFVNETLKSLLD
jgi:hypothetical protein